MEAHDLKVSLFENEHLWPLGIEVTRLVEDLLTLTLVSLSLSLSYMQIAEMIRHVLNMYEESIPAILEIPSKDHPYDPTKDSILRRAKVCMQTYSFLMELGLP